MSTSITYSIKKMLAAGLGFLILSTAIQASANSTNARPCDTGAGPPDNATAPGYGERLIGICHLDDTSNRIEYKPSTIEQGVITFGVRSCSPNAGSATCDHAAPYSVRVSGPSQNNHFVLERSSWFGTQRLPISLRYTSLGVSEELLPGQFSSSSHLFPSSANGQLAPAAIEISLAPGASYSGQYYSGEFALSIDQCGSNDNSGPPPCNGNYPVTTLAEIHFSIEIWQEAEIRISGLEDMLLDATTSSLGTVEASQEFCVYGTPLETFLWWTWTYDSSLFRVTADSQNGNGSFILRGINDLEYEIEIASVDDGFSENLREGTPSNTRWRGHGDLSCANYSDENMRITIRVPQEQLESAIGSSYTDTLTLTVELE